MSLDRGTVVFVHLDAGIFLGERIQETAGNAALEEIAVALGVRKESFGVTTNIRLEHLFPSSRMLTEITGALVAPSIASTGCWIRCASSRMKRHSPIAGISIAKKLSESASAISKEPGRLSNIAP